MDKDIITKIELAKANEFSIITGCLLVYKFSCNFDALKEEAKHHKKLIFTDLSPNFYVIK